MTRFLVTGASGLLGLNFALEFCHQHEIVAVVNQHSLDGAPFEVVQADLLEPGRVSRLLDETRPEVIVHCAALALPDQSEKDPRYTGRLNTWLPGELARETRQRGIRLVHISTDSVFDGQRGFYSESDTPGPLNTYARSKLAAEQEVASANADAIIARVVFYGWSLYGQRGLSEFFYYNLSAGKAVKGYTDVIFSPLLANDLARILVKMVEKNLTGLYHVFSSESLSKYDFGVQIARCFGLDENLIQPVSLRSAPLPAPRSPDLSMRVGKLEQALGEQMPDQAVGLAHLYQQWKDGYPQKLMAYGSL